MKNSFLKPPQKTTQNKSEIGDVPHQLIKIFIYWHDIKHYAKYIFYKNKLFYSNRNKYLINYVL